MLIAVISLAVSLVSLSNFYAPPKQQSNPNQPPQNNHLQQENKDSKQAAIVPIIPLTVSMKPIALPAGDNAWTIQIVSTGGFTGAGSGDLTVTSEGSLTWSGADGSCSRELTGQAIQALTSTIVAANIPATSSEASRTSLCGDCYVTTMILQRRGPAGITTSTVYWDEVSRATVSTGVLTIYDAAMAHKGCKLP